jgi:hypothetical protein
MKRVAVLLSLFLGGGAVAVTPAQLCQAGKDRLAGRYTDCRLQAEARRVMAAEADATEALAACAAQFQRAWAALEGRVPDCPTVGDAAAVQAVLDGNTTNVATGLAGEGVVDYQAALAQCQGQLSLCGTAVIGCEREVFNLHQELAACYASP